MRREQEPFLSVTGTADSVYELMEQTDRHDEESVGESEPVSVLSFISSGVRLTDDFPNQVAAMLQQLFHDHPDVDAEIEKLHTTWQQVMDAAQKYKDH